jgi:hypothetical protein
MDVVTSYLYSLLDLEIYMREPQGLRIPRPNECHNLFSVCLQRLLYELKQSRRMWFNQLSNFPLKIDYRNNMVIVTVFYKEIK